MHGEEQPDRQFLGSTLNCHGVAQIIGNNRKREAQKQGLVPEANAYREILDSMHEQPMFSVRQLQLNLDIKKKDHHMNSNKKRARLIRKQGQNIQNPRVILDEGMCGNIKEEDSYANNQTLNKMLERGRERTSPIRGFQWIRNASISKKKSSIHSSQPLPIKRERGIFGGLKDGEGITNHYWQHNRKLSQPESQTTQNLNLNLNMEGRGSRTTGVNSPMERRSARSPQPREQKKFEDLSDKFEIVVNFLNHPIQQMPIYTKQSNQNYIPLNQQRRESLLNYKMEAKNWKPYEEFENDLLEKKELGRKKLKLIRRVMEEFRESGSKCARLGEYKGKVGRGRNVAESIGVKSLMPSSTIGHKNVITPNIIHSHIHSQNLSDYSNLVKDKDNVVIEIPKPKRKNMDVDVELKSPISPVASPPFNIKCNRFADNMRNSNSHRGIRTTVSKNSKRVNNHNHNHNHSNRNKHIGGTSSTIRLQQNKGGPILSLNHFFPIGGLPLKGYSAKEDNADIIDLYSALTLSPNK